MPKYQTQVLSNASADDVEISFYEALQSGDIDKLMACWADEDDIVCVHPGGARLVGAPAIRAGFEALFANGTIRAQPERIHRVESMGACLHSLIERVEILTPDGPAQAYVTATNVFHKTAQGWRMVAHHASPGMPAPAEPLASPGVILH
jgi:ketosteroid isomerase-like protein